MTAQYTKWSCEVAVPEAIPHTLARAYAIAAEAPMGPVHVAIPTDLYDVDVSRIDFAHDFENCRTFDRTCADETGLDAIAAMLSEARLPVIIAGGEVAQLGAVEALVELAEALGAPVLLEDLPAYMSFPTTHPQYAGSIAANKPLLAMADAVFAVGVEFTENGYSFEGPVFPNPVRLAALSVDQALSAKRLWPELMVSGHPEPSLRRLSAFVNQRGMGSAIRQARLEVSTKRRTERAQSVEAARALDRNRSPLLPQQLIHELAQACGEDWIIVQAGSTVGFHFDSLYEMSNPYDFHSLTGKGSAQGWGGPVATGIQLAAPDRRVLALLGDGNFMFTATAIWIAVQQNLPVVFVVINNNGWASMRGAMRVLGNEDPSAGDFDRMGWTFGDAPIDYVGFARSLGLDGMRATTAAEFNDCLQDAARTARPTLIDVVTEMVDVI